MATTQDLSTLKINYLTQEQYNTALTNNEINSDEIYLTPQDNGELIVSSEDASTPEAYPEQSIWLKYGNASGGQADWIVEQNTVGAWTYRKWNSGIAECWGQFVDSSTIETESLGMYRSQGIQPTYPTGLFVGDAPLVECSCYGSTIIKWPVCNVAPTLTSPGNWVLYRPTANTSAANKYFVIRATGTWKQGGE